MPSTVDEGIPAKLAHRRTPTANDFPVPIGHTPSAGKRDQGLISPTQSSFTFTDEDLYPHAISTPCTMPSSPITRDFDRGTPGEGGSRATSVNGYTEQKELGRKRSQHYADTLTVREPLMSARDRVHKDSVIMAEVKTNVIVCAPHFALDRGDAHSLYHRLEMNSSFSASYLNTSLNATSAQPPQFSSPSTIPPASYLPAPSNPPTSSQSLLFLPKSHPQPTSETLPSPNRLCLPPWACYPIAAS